MATNTVKLMFDGELVECLPRTDEAAGETICYAKNGRHIKFPADVPLAEAIKAHNKANGEMPVFADEQEAERDAELAAFLMGE